MLTRLLWRLVTPRKLRRVTLVALLMWLGVAYVHDSGTASRVREQLPRQVQIEGPVLHNVPRLPTLAPRNGDGF